MLPVLLAYWSGVFTGTPSMYPYFLVWRRDTTESCGRQFRRGWSVRSTEAVGRGKGSLKVLFCCRAREKPEELVLGEKESLEDLQIGYLLF